MSFAAVHPSAPKAFDVPVYEYKCTVCSNHFDIEQSFTDDALTTLEGCEVDDEGQHRLKKVFSAVGISFKGDGFYRNDSRGKTSSSTSSPSSSSSGDGGSSTSGSSSDSSGSNGSNGGSSSSDSSGSSSSSASSGSSGSSTAAS
jgi:putative FmdB family regulatory protein